MAVPAIFLACMASADVSLPGIIGGNMVIQRECKAPLWGWADPGEKVSVSGSWGGKADSVADQDGAWSVKLDTPKAGGPFSITIEGKNKIVLENVLSGDVWVCSGQSNMEMGIKACSGADTEIPAADNPSIRLFKVPLNLNLLPQMNLDASWKVCSPTTVSEGQWAGFSAAGYYFGRKLNKSLNVPVGLIQSSFGGT